MVYLMVNPHLVACQIKWIPGQLHQLQVTLIYTLKAICGILVHKISAILITVFFSLVSQCTDPGNTYHSQNEVTPRDDLDYTHHSYQDMEKVCAYGGGYQQNCTVQWFTQVAFSGSYSCLSSFSCFSVVHIGCLLCRNHQFTNPVGGFLSSICTVFHWMNFNV